MSWISTILIGILWLAVSAVALMVLAAICMAIFYKSGYSDQRKISGAVTSMDYTPPRSTTTFNGKTTTVSTRPAIHDVHIKTGNGNLKLNDVELYQRVRIGEKATVVYQSKFVKPRFWEGPWMPDGTRVLKVVAVDGEVIEINDEMPSPPDLLGAAGNRFD